MLKEALQLAEQVAPDRPEAASFVRKYQVLLVGERPQEAETARTAVEALRKDRAGEDEADFFDLYRKTRTRDGAPKPSAGDGGSAGRPMTCATDDR